MHWKLFATLADAAGQREVPVAVGADETHPDTVGEALEALLERHPELRAVVFDEHGDLHGHVRLLHNGTDPFEAADGLDTAVQVGDELALFPPVSGG